MLRGRPDVPGLTKKKPWAREGAPNVQNVIWKSPMIPDAEIELSAPGRKAGFSEPGSFDMTCRKRIHGAGERSRYRREVNLFTFYFPTYAIASISILMPARPAATVVRAGFTSPK